MSFHEQKHITLERIHHQKPHYTYDIKKVHYYLNFNFQDFIQSQKHFQNPSQRNIAILNQSQRQQRLISPIGYIFLFFNIQIALYQFTLLFVIFLKRSKICDKKRQ
ncbi:hypothetical protein pb186bvf_004892 [Paramecium bursaria]